jgi:hypothetical protein
MNTGQRGRPATAFDRIMATCDRIDRQLWFIQWQIVVITASVVALLLKPYL